MNLEFRGALCLDDPLYAYVRAHIEPQLGFVGKSSGYRVYQFSHASSVYLYEEKRRQARFIGKFFKTPLSHVSPDALNPAENEYRNLVFLRSLGFDHPPHYVVRPLGCAPDINNFLALEYLPAESLDSIILAAIYQGGRQRLFRKLSALAHFLATLHNRTARYETVNFDAVLVYLERVLRTHRAKRDMSEATAWMFSALGQRWRNRACMWEDRSVLVHGDATPPNFLFGSGKNVMAIDLERMQWADRLFDVGRLCGELKHFFLRASNDKNAAEPFIGHFLWEYAHHFPDHERTFAAITQRVPFYLGLTLLRIARNRWVDNSYRTRLLSTAKTILEASP